MILFSLSSFFFFFLISCTPSTLWSNLFLLYEKKKKSPFSVLCIVSVISGTPHANMSSQISFFSYFGKINKVKELSISSWLSYASQFPPSPPPLLISCRSFHEYSYKGCFWILMYIKNSILFLWFVKFISYKIRDPDIVAKYFVVYSLVKFRWWRRDSFSSFLC